LVGRPFGCHRLRLSGDRAGQRNAFEIFRRLPPLDVVTPTDVACPSYHPAIGAVQPGQQERPVPSNRWLGVFGRDITRAEPLARAACATLMPPSRSRDGGAYPSTERAATGDVQHGREVSFATDGPFRGPQPARFIGRRLLSSRVSEDGCYPGLVTKGARQPDR
jgi:hypothetical protein